jgi:hypothetical protein
MCTDLPFDMLGYRDEDFVKRIPTKKTKYKVKKHSFGKVSHFYVQFVH